jgi:hypothetical protein
MEDGSVVNTIYTMENWADYFQALHLKLAPTTSI